MMAASLDDKVVVKLLLELKVDHSTVLLAHDSLAEKYNLA
jgi:hypothetical protein